MYSISYINTITQRQHNFMESDEDMIKQTIIFTNKLISKQNLNFSKQPNIEA